MDHLTALLEEQVKDLYNAENQLLKAMPRLGKAASTPKLKAAFEKHLRETEVQVQRLEKVAELMEIKPKGKVCAAMKGLIEEGKEVLEEDGADGVIDAALIAAAQRVEHYEIAAYGTARALATAIGRNDLVKLFEQTLKEEKATDDILTQIAERDVYATAPKSEEEIGGEEEEE